MITPETLLKNLHDIAKLDKQVKILDMITTGVLVTGILLGLWIWVLMATLVLLFSVIMKHKTKQHAGFRIHKVVKNLFEHPEQCSTIAFYALHEDKKFSPFVYKHLRTIKNTDSEEVRMQAVWSALKDAGALKERNEM